MRQSRGEHHNRNIISMKIIINFGKLPTFSRLTHSENDAIADPVILELKFSVEVR